MIKSLTSLRGIFILFIFLHHCMNLYPGGGTMAVAFFFVLGGFGMTLGYKEKILAVDFDYRQFVTRRCIKFYPLHCLCLLLSLPLVLMEFRWYQIPVFFVNASLFQSWIPFPQIYFSFNAVSWYLADTMFFALAFPFVTRWILRANTRGHILVAFLLILLYLSVAILVPQQMHHAILYINPFIRFPDFLFGMYIALLYLRLKEKPAKWWNGAVVSHLLIFAAIALLVVESCILSDEARLVAPVYWALIGVVILVASQSDRIGGGRIYLKTRFYNALAN